MAPRDPITERHGCHRAIIDALNHAVTVAVRAIRIIQLIRV